MKRIIEKLNDTLVHDLDGTATSYASGGGRKTLGYEVDGHFVTVIIEPIDRVEGATAA